MGHPESILCPRREGAVTGLTPRRKCGGLSIDDALSALDTIDDGRTDVSREAAEATSNALDVSESGCRRCGEPTLGGTLREMAT
jgi:hypothetical protein